MCVHLFQKLFVSKRKIEVQLAAASKIKLGYYHQSIFICPDTLVNRNETAFVNICYLEKEQRQITQQDLTPFYFQVMIMTERMPLQNNIMG